MYVCKYPSCPLSLLYMASVRTCFIGLPAAADPPLAGKTLDDDDDDGVDDASVPSGGLGRVVFLAAQHFEHIFNITPQKLSHKTEI